MSQHDFSISDQGMPAARSDLNAGLQALASTSKGPSAPATPYAGQLWLDDDTPSGSVWTLKGFDGTDWISLGTFDTTANTFTPTNAAMLNAANAFTKTQTWARGSDVASASALTLGDGNIFNVTGNTTITSIGAKGVGTVAILRFAGNPAPQLTHHATDLVLPGGVSLKTAVGDYAIFEEYASGDWRLASYLPAVGVPLAQGRHTIWMPAVAMKARITAGAAPGTIETTTNKQNIDVLDFDQTTNEFAQFRIGMPKSWDLGTVTAQFLWTASAGTAAQVAIWGIQAVATSDDDPLDAAFGTGVEVSDALLATGDDHKSAETAAVTVAGTPAANDMVSFQVYRNAASGSDTLAADARLIGVRLFITLNAGNDA